VKKQRSSVTEDVKVVLAVIAGQFLVVALKGDGRSLAEFRMGYVRHCERLLGPMSKEDLEYETVMAGRAFTSIMASRYGWSPEAKSALSACVEDACHAWISGADIASPIARLRVVDIWSGIASCMSGVSKIPLAMLDYALMVLLPVVCASEVRNVVTAVAGVSAYDVESLNAVDAALELCVSRLCCHLVMNDSMCNELKLAVLLHLPKDEGTLAANEGLAYKMLQRQYANTGVK